MNKPEATDNLMPIRDFAETYLSRRGQPVTVSYIYRLIREHKAGTRLLDFDYIEEGKQIWIVKEK